MKFPTEQDIYDIIEDYGPMTSTEILEELKFRGFEDKRKCQLAIQRASDSYDGNGHLVFGAGFKLRFPNQKDIDE